MHRHHERPSHQADYQLLFESAPDAVVMVDRLGVITSVNRQTEILFGYEAVELLGESVEMLMPEGARVRHAAHRRTYVKDPKVRPMGTGLTLRGLRKDGSQFPVEVSLSSLKTEGRFLVCSIIRDVTDREENERALREGTARYRALSAQLIQAREAERRKVARELHDGLNQEIAQLCIEAGTLLQQFGAASDEGEQLRGFQERLTSLSSHVRRLSHELHPATLEILGLPAALQTMCAEVGHRPDLDIAVTVDDVPSMPSFDVAVNLYRIAQECLHNVIQHADADMVTVNLTRLNGSLELTVTDDGIGFDPDAARMAGGLGLVSMEERARLVGGRVVLASTPGHGSTVHVEVPCQEG